jgi:2-polyprenyl-3-methyl-5-hydroxy-6-metoxy-1,4-benzoquinol methylase
MSMHCPVCQTTALQEIAAIEQVPVHCNTLHDTPELARAATRGDIVLGFCDHCSMIYNTAFDETLLSYGQDYENSLHFSPRFQDYATGLANDLLQNYGSTDLDILEIGCGKGDFLKLLTAHGANRCVGYDASFQESVNPTTGIPGLNIYPEFFSPDIHKERADLLINRHVLEHMANPIGFARTLGQGLKDSATAAIFCEVPNGLWTLRDLGIWDLIYEHCSYFTENSLLRVIEAGGFYPTRTHTQFGEQFLCIEASRQTAQPPTPQCSMEEICSLADSFGSHLATKRATWEDRLAEYQRQDQRVVTWGAGSKGVTFLNIISGADSIEAAVDINPRKAGRYIPGTGQAVHNPKWLQGKDIDLVLVMNPIYESEIQSQLAQLGCPAKTLTV